MKKKKIIKKVKKKKKIKKKRKGKKVEMEFVYKLLNKVQIMSKKQKFSVEIEDADTIENVIKDVKLGYKRMELKTKVNFVIFPNDEEIDNDEEDFDINKFFELDIYEDEVKEDGILF